ncbi:S8 family serine peptidase [Marinobacter koreensis]|uniref:S8 family serine peptidase n=1 Tax=Marinobacter koreensis TaxID=335974 RepID=UPI00360F47A6
MYRALDWVASNSGADIVNLSLGGLPYDQELEAKLANLKANNIIVVAAAGNDRSNVPTYPGASRSVFGVSAVDAAGNLASYSNYGDRIDLAGPGGDGSRDANFDGKADLVLSSSAILGDGGYFEPAYIGLQGTSMAAPHVSGVFALMKEAKPNLDVVNDLESWLMAGRLTNGSAGSKTPNLVMD